MITTYEVPVYVSYKDVVSSVTYLPRKRWDKNRPAYVASADMRGIDDTEWRRVDGEVFYGYDDKGHLTKIDVRFDGPHVGFAGDVFFVDSPYLGDE